MIYENKNGVLVPIESIYDNTKDNFKQIVSQYENKNGTLVNVYEGKFPKKYYIIKNGVATRNFYNFFNCEEEKSGGWSTPNYVYGVENNKGSFCTFYAKSTRNASDSNYACFFMVTEKGYSFGLRNYYTKMHIGNSKIKGTSNYSHNTETWGPYMSNLGSWGTGINCNNLPEQSGNPRDVVISGSQFWGATIADMGLAGGFVKANIPKNYYCVFTIKIDELYLYN